MRLLTFNNYGELSLTKHFSVDNIPEYAILSHTWEADTEEVTFSDLVNGTGKSKAGYDKSKAGYDKVRFCGEQAKQDGLQYFRVNTCCINKSNNTELSEAINSMFRWYRDAAKCYAYLIDVSENDQTDLSLQPWEVAFGNSRWLTRSWTLQELIAPRSAKFFSKDWEWLGDKKSLERHICEATGFPAEALQRSPLPQFSFTERMSWEEIRETTREENKAYTLLGIFDIQVPITYGERRVNARKRFCEEIDKPLKGFGRLLSATDWPFNSYHKQHEPTCLLDTRVNLLQKIHDWADGQNERRIIWLNGLAGTGKSTITRTVARKYYTNGRPGASLFFSRGDGAVGHAGEFVTSIAAQLAGSIPTVNQGIRGAIREHSDVTSRSFRDQWQQLVLRWLLKPRSNNYCASCVVVVVIDALDECDLKCQFDTASPKYLRLNTTMSYSHLYQHLAAGFLASVSSSKRENGLVTMIMSNQRISWFQDWSELGEEGASQIVDLGLGRFHRISDNSAVCARATLDTGNVSGNLISDDMLKVLKCLFNEDKHQLEEDGPRSAPSNGWLRQTWHEIDVWWRWKIELLLGFASLKQLGSIRSTETVVEILKVFKSLPKVPRGGKRRPGRFSLLALPFTLTWATPAAAELSHRESMGSSLRPSILPTYGDQHYEIQKFLFELMKLWQHDAETAISSEALLVACFFCTCLTVLLFTVRHRDKCQKYFFAAGILLSAIVGAACSEGAQDFIFRYLFFGVNFSLILSTFYHIKYSARQNSSVKGWPASQKNSAGREFEHVIGTFGDEKGRST